MAKGGKFAGIDFSETEVEQLTPERDITGQGFRCNRPEFVTFWKRGRILREVEAHLSHCWFIQHEANLVGYITLLADKLEVETPLLNEENIRYRTFPAVKIGLLAADHRASGAGRRLVEWALEYIVAELCPALGIRFVTVDALYDLDTGYDSYGPPCYGLLL